MNASPARENVSATAGFAAQSGLAYARRQVNDGRAGRWNESRIAGIMHAGGTESRGACANRPEARTHMFFPKMRFQMLSFLIAFPSLMLLSAGTAQAKVDI